MIHQNFQTKKLNKYRCTLTKDRCKDTSCLLVIELFDSIQPLKFFLLVTIKTKS